MLKVTILKAADAEVWELEGRLSEAWVAELHRCWLERPQDAASPLRINLKAVSFVDVSGKQLLRAMHQHGVEIAGCGCMTRALVEEVTRGGDASAPESIGHAGDIGH
jgi:anti-anti-sigma regulatory factor